MSQCWALRMKGFGPIADQKLYTLSRFVQVQITRTNFIIFTISQICQKKMAVGAHMIRLTDCICCECKSGLIVLSISGLHSALHLKCMRAKRWLGKTDQARIEPALAGFPASSTSRPSKTLIRAPELGAVESTYVLTLKQDPSVWSL